MQITLTEVPNVDYTYRGLKCRLHLLKSKMQITPTKVSNADYTYRGQGQYFYDASVDSLQLCSGLTCCSDKRKG